MTLPPCGGFLVGESAAMRELRARITRVGPTDFPVLVQGPTGCGKELVARELHAASRRAGSLVAFNVCAIADTMFEDALFGHVRGAFTSATDCSAGFLAEANHGTVFFDEISGLQLGTQAKLLRAVETREYRQVGASLDRKSDFRVVAATNVSLAERVSSGAFREDLYHRLNCLVIDVPPLSAHMEDVPALVEHFLAVAGMRFRPLTKLTESALQLLMSSPWPGNVRQLRNFVERAVVLCDAPVLNCEHARRLLRTGQGRSGPDGGRPARNALSALLEEHGWDTAAVAERLGTHRATVYRRMARLGIAAARLGARRWPLVDVQP